MSRMRFRALESVLDLLLLTVDPHPESVLPSLSLLAHNVRSAPTEVSSLLEAGTADVAIVDARTDLAAARLACAGCSAPPEPRCRWSPSSTRAAWWR